jgi:hypothetical protein
MSAAELADAGQPVRFTPHDFRRLFATDAVNGGLPLHIAAGLLGHLNLDTTCGDTNSPGIASDGRSSAGRLLSSRPQCSSVTGSTPLGCVP